MQIIEDYEGSNLVQWCIVMDLKSLAMIEAYTGMSDHDPMQTYTKTFNLMVF
jgi:hypothetical protein